MIYVFLLIGFYILIKGADAFVDGASSIARRFNIPPIIIGLTIVAFGTSAPEAAVSVTAALSGKNDIAIGNVVGSNIFNLLLVIGVSSFLLPIKVKRNTMLKEFPFALLASIVLIILSHDVKFQDYPFNSLTRADGLVLLSLFGIFMYYLIELALTSNDEMDVTEGNPSAPLSRAILMSLIGVICVVIGGQIVVDNATEIALNLGMSENLTGLTIVSIGTSLPELVTSISAAKKGESDIAIGNVIGSNLFNILFVLGLSSVIHPISVQSIVFIDMLIMLIVTLIVYLFSLSKKTISKAEGSILTILYVLYMIYIIIRQ